MCGWECAEKCIFYSVAEHEGKGDLVLKSQSEREDGRREGPSGLLVRETGPSETSPPQEEQIVGRVALRIRTK